MNPFDVAILLVLGIMFAKGVWLGLIRELCGLLGLGGAAVLASRYDLSLAGAVATWVNSPQWLLRGICFATLFIVTLIFFSLLGVLLSRAFQAVQLGGLNRLCGGLFGLLAGIVVLSLGLYGLSTTDWFKETRESSRLAPPFEILGGQMVAGGRQLLR